MAPVDCVSDPAGCPRASTCVARDVWCEIGSAIENILSGTTLADMCDRLAAKDAAGTVSYDI